MKKVKEIVCRKNRWITRDTRHVTALSVCPVICKLVDWTQSSLAADPEVIPGKEDKKRSFYYLYNGYS